jgi:hypothetical protein
VAHQFLSDDWLSAVQSLAEEAGPGLLPATVSLNLLVTGGPSGDRELHVAEGAFAAGFVEAPTKLTLPYDVARAMFVEGNQQAAMQAFMSGQIKVEGDMSKLMAMQGGGGPGDGGLQKKLQDITAPAHPIERRQERDDWGFR